MEVKIYRELENENLILDEEQLKEYNQLASELGLQEEGKETTPNVYIILNQSMKRQLKAICPSIVNAEDYTRSTIPLEVLKVYKYAKDNEMFDGFEIWYADKDPDPLLIGKKWQSEEAKKRGYNWQKDSYLIARWGDCALELEELLKVGFNILRQEVLDKATLATERVASMTKNPDIYVRQFLEGTSLDIKIKN